MRKNKNIKIKDKRKKRKEKRNEDKNQISKENQHLQDPRHSVSTDVWWVVRWIDEWF